MTRRSASLAARTCKVCSFFPCGLLAWSELVGGEPDGLDAVDPFCDPVSVKVVFLTLVALIGMPSNSGWISCTSTIGIGPVSVSDPSDDRRKSSVGALGPFGDLGEARSTILGPVTGIGKPPFRSIGPALWVPGFELP